MYGQATQGGCSLGLCTSPAWPAPASPTRCSPDWPPFYILASGPSWWLFLSRGQWGACPLPVSLVTSERTCCQSLYNWRSPLPRERSLPCCPARRWPHTVGCHSRTLLQTSKLPHRLNHWCLGRWPRALSSVLKLGEYRPCRPAGCRSTARLNIQPNFK